ncbi:MAG: aminotransferase class V-fold PLP-dependent enzyme [Actinomycetota bacterium]
MRRHRLDRLTSSALRPEAVEAQRAWLELEAAGDLGPDDVDRALARVREQLAHLLGVRTHELVLTSGSVEATHTAVAGVMHRHGGGHLICTTADDRRVLDAARRWADDVTIVAVDEHGRIDPAVVAAEVRADTVLVCLPVVSADSGAVQPVRVLTRACRDRGIVTLLDAVAGVGRIGIDLADLGADLGIVDAAPFGGGLGAGALHVRRGVRIDPLLPGAEQRLRRGGPIAPGPSIGMGAAATAITGRSLLDEVQRAEELAIRLARRLGGLPGIEVADHVPDRIAGHLRLRLGHGEAAAVVERLAGSGIHLGCTVDGDLRCAPDWSCGDDAIDALDRAVTALGADRVDR